MAATTDNRLYTVYFVSRPEKLHRVCKTQDFDHEALVDEFAARADSAPVLRHLVFCARSIIHHGRSATQKQVQCVGIEFDQWFINVIEQNRFLFAIEPQSPTLHCLFVPTVPQTPTP